MEFYWTNTVCVCVDHKWKYFERISKEIVWQRSRMRFEHIDY